MLVVSIFSTFPDNIHRWIELYIVIKTVLELHK